MKMCARRTAEYEEELCGPKEEKEPRRQLVDAVFNLQPRIVLRRADITEDLRTKQQKPEPPHIKDEMEDEEVHHIKGEEEPISIKKEEEEARSHIKQEEEDLTTFPSTGVPLKCEDAGQSEESRGAEPPSSSSSQHMATEGDGDRCGGSQAGGLLAPLSDSDDMTSHSTHTEDDDKQSEGLPFLCCKHPRVAHGAGSGDLDSGGGTRSDTPASGASNSPQPHPVQHMRAQTTETLQGKLTVSYVR
ncbi:uncharacterized protein LOC133398278 isoform X3 [Phycodurus eques]|uniref:uncharacterized protein LOC133398278 isoform X3 n=1 Tax=Phycodurus eques TaxID=693459 RepID=UPI002ACEC861|nr:uncharacterized protein LOC133398278 isoform X3 [Phycodurus eques]